MDKKRRPSATPATVESVQFFEATKQFEARPLTRELRDTVLSDVFAWLKAGQPRGFTVDFAVTDTSGLERSGTFESPEDVDSFVGPSVSMAKVCMSSDQEDRPIYIALYGAGTGSSNYASVKSTSDAENQSFLSRLVQHFEAFPTAAANQAQPNEVNKVTRELRLPGVVITPADLVDLWQVTWALLGQNPNSLTRGTFEIEGSDKSGKHIQVEVKDAANTSVFSDFRVVDRVWIRKEALVNGMDHSLSLTLRAPDRWLKGSLNATSADVGWVEQVLFTLGAWARRHKPPLLSLANLRHVLSSLVWFVPPLVVGLVVATTIISHTPKPSSQSSDRLGSLKRARSNLEDSIKYVRALEMEIRDRRIALEAVQKEHAKWQPLARTDKVTVEAMGRLLVHETNRNRFRDMAITFIVGVISGFAANWLFLFGQARRRRAQERNEPPDRA